ncbi:class I SAM-dependent methyltransferase [Kitasatospora sp. NPDC048540]|uniref:class I SAM-dependent methyltransferase n=1 Tax=unclassified Kitasatospora TaxID=2633591 RepID=UPI00053B728D|nr:class I SAM-dependent methyltransferase [Kitasatospora sp. MBT63]
MAILHPDADLERSPVVANRTMNRERTLTGVNSYARELGFDPAAWLLARSGPVSWLDLCSGEARALFAAAGRLPEDAVLTGVDLVGPLGQVPVSPAVDLVTASLADWTPARRYDLITCVHGLHYLGDKLGLLARAAGWLNPDGLFAAQFDPASVRRADGGSAARPVLAALRAAGFAYRPRRHLLTLDGHRELRFAFEYLGADPAAGPNFTGQPGVASYYA